MRKILYTKDYGVGWTNSCDTREQAQFAVSYQPIVDAIERGEKLDNNPFHFGSSKHKSELFHPAILSLIKEAKEKFYKEGDEDWRRYTPYLGIVNNLAIARVDDECLVRISEYNGKERVEPIWPDLSLL